tara:strand:+ start:8472 stop:9638 length:1167 start_codon:yes stop_codon:yes gene_type:complete
MSSKIIKKISNEISDIIKKQYGIKNNYHLYSPKFYKGTIEDLKKTIESTWVSTKGPQVEIFEKTIGKLVKSKNILATNSGTSALHLAFIAINASSNDEILMPSLNFVASANAVLYCRANPVFIDCNPKNLGISADEIDNFIKKKCRKVGKFYFNKKTKKKIKAVVAVHLYGAACDIVKIKKICNKYNIHLIEDAAECLGSKYNGKHLGTFGDFGVLSFNGNKVVTTGSGGAIITKKKSSFNIVKNYLNLNKSTSLDEEYKNIGYNYKMNALCATLGMNQIKKLDYIVKKKYEIFLNYKKEFKNSEFIDMIDSGNCKESNNWLVCVQLKTKYQKFKKRILFNLNKDNIYSRSIWKPLHKLNHLKKFQKENLRITNKVFKKTFCLPSSLI